MKINEKITKEYKKGYIDGWTAYYYKSGQGEKDLEKAKKEWNEMERKGKERA